MAVGLGRFGCPHVSLCVCQLTCLPLCHGTCRHPIALWMGMGQILRGANHPSAKLCPFARALTCRGGRGVPRGQGPSWWHH